MVRLDFWFGLSSVGRRRIVSGVCFGLMLLAGPVSATDIKSNRITNALEMVSNWLKSIRLNKLAVSITSAKGVRVALLESDEQVIRQRDSIYFGFFGTDNSYKVELTGKNCSQIVSSKQENLYHSVVFNGCKFIEGSSYNIRIGPYSETNKGNEFAISNKSCAKYANTKPMLEAYQLAYEKPRECVFEAYQLIVGSNKIFAKTLALGKMPSKKLPQ